DLLFRKALLHVRLLLRKRTLLDSGWPCLQGAGHGFAGWLAGAWDTLGEEDIALLTSIGATLYREGYGRRY
ncbi:hypothetical protein, partial [Burkholderia vietnamiensis]